MVWWNEYTVTCSIFTYLLRLLQSCDRILIFACCLSCNLLITVAIWTKQTSLTWILLVQSPESQIVVWRDICHCFIVNWAMFMLNSRLLYTVLVCCAVYFVKNLLLWCKLNVHINTAVKDTPLNQIRCKPHKISFKNRIHELL